MILYTTLHSAVNISMHLGKSFTISIYTSYKPTNYTIRIHTNYVMLIQVIASLSNTVDMVQSKTNNTNSVAINNLFQWIFLYIHSLLYIRIYKLTNGL